MTHPENAPAAGRSLGRLGLLGLLLVVLATTFGCANGEIRLSDPFDRQLSLEEAQHRYTVLVRWSQFQKAQKFVARENRAEFLKRMKVLDDARFTDFESEVVETEGKRDSATVRVEYTLYLPSSPYETQIVEIQDWTRGNVSNGWTVVSTFESLPNVAAN